MADIPPRIVAQSSLFDAPPMSTEDRMEAAWKEHAERHLGKPLLGTWDSRPEILQKFGVHVFFPDPSETRACCRAIDQRDEALKKDPRRLEKHVKSYKHVAALFDLDAKAFLAFCKKRDRRHLETYSGHILGSTLKY